MSACPSTVRARGGAALSSSHRADYDNANHPPAVALTVVERRDDMPEPQATVPSAHATRTRIGGADHVILEALARYYYLTADQVLRLFYSPGSRSTVKDRLLRMTRAGLIQRWPFYAKYPAGVTHVYHLAGKGSAYLRATGMDLPLRYRPSEQTDRSDFFLRHELACNDVYIGARLLHKHHPAVTLAAFRHDRELRQQRTRVSLTRSGKPAQTVTVIPDGWLEFHITDDPAQTPLQQCVVLELDGDTEDQTRWRRKVAELVTYAHGPYRQQFGTESITIAVIAYPKNPDRAAARLAALRAWTEQELAALGQQQEADLFRLTATPPAADPYQLFIAPGWFRPFDVQPLPLLDGVPPRA